MRNRSKSLHVPPQPFDESDNETSESDDPEPLHRSVVDDKDTITGWSNDDERTLIANVRQQTGNSKRKYTTDLKHLRWENVRFDEYTANDCQIHFQKLVRSVRPFRILPEIIQDIEAELLKMPFKRPPTAFNIYIKECYQKEQNNDFTGLSKTYKELTPYEKLRYEQKAKELKDDYTQKMKDFYKDNPKTATLKNKRTPFKLFSDYNKLKGTKLTFAEIRNEYTNLSVDAKYKWIEKWAKMYPDVNPKEYLTKEEARLLVGQLKQPPTAYALYFKDVYDEFKGDGAKASEIMSSIGKQWRNTSEEIKDKYNKRSKELKERHKLTEKTFAERHDIHLLQKPKGPRVRKMSKVSNGSDASDSPSTKTGTKKTTDTKAKIQASTSSTSINAPKKSRPEKTETSQSALSSPVKSVQKSPEKSPKKKPAPTASKSPKKASKSTDENDGNGDNNDEWPSPIIDYIKQFKTKAGIRDDTALSFLPSINSTKQNELPKNSPKKASNENRKRAFHDIDIDVGPDSDTPQKQSKNENNGKTNGPIEKIKFNNFTYVVKKAISEKRTKWQCSRKDSKQCDAKLITEIIDGVHTVIKERGEHSHSAKKKKD